VAKLQQFCCTAAKCGFRWAWSDTCCINKKSSAEESESINSMFKWYRNSALTIVYLHDVNDDSDGRKPPEWCSRVWTLQEMLAPRFLRFYSQDWGLLEQAFDGDYDQARVLQLNTKKRNSTIIDHRGDTLWKVALSGATGIDQGILTSFKPGLEHIGEKFRWAAKRNTTKLEDRAYSLFGIFDLHMPVIYGEGDRSFTRLQEELIKCTNDLTLFDW
ncbi:hypothetical protein BU15DRAFT_27497, partial [Melanogaster broomeanus]